MKKQVKKGYWGLVIVFFALIAFAGPVFGQPGDVEDITEQVLTGPSDLNPEKILGPGGIGIKTHKNLLMSFGATVRLIPTSESDWDFGMSDNVPGYFYTEDLKTFAGISLDTANAVQDVYKSSLALENALKSTDSAVISTFDDFTNALSTANNITNNKHPNIVPFAQGALSIQELGNSTGNTASAAFSSGFVAGGSAGGAVALEQAATQAETQAAALQTAAAANPQDANLVQKAGGATAAAAGLRAAANSIAKANTALEQNPSDPALQQQANLAAANIATTANAATIKAMEQNANLVEKADTLAAGVAKTVNKDSGDTAIDLTQSIAYLSVLKATADSFQPYYLANSFLKTHSNESGSVNDGYIRSETKLYFNAMPKDKKWSFYAALEYDRPIDNSAVDNRGGKDAESSNFGLERLNASIELVDGLRFHGGWDIWGIDIIEAGSMVYGDDNPGFWINGDYDPLDFSIAWIKLEENDFQINTGDHGGAADEDRDLIAGYMDYKFREKDKVRFFYGYDRIRNIPSLDLTGSIASAAGLQDYAGIYGNNGIPGATAASPEIDAHTIGAYYIGNFNIVELMVEGAYKYGSADDTGLAGVYNGINTIQYNDFDISAYAFSASLGFELKDLVGWQSFKPHIGITYTSGDDDPNDDTLSGFTGITSAQRFSKICGGENTIIGDTNFVLGSGLYGYIPELYGNGTPVFTGGIQNMAGSGNGRGDNPGLSMFSFGFTLRPKIFLIYRTNANMFYWNEDFYVADMVKPIVFNNGVLEKGKYTKVEAGYVGTEWDNELTVALSKNMFVKTQASLFFPGEAIEDVTYALSGGLEKSDEIATRLAMEFIWNF